MSGPAKGGEGGAKGLPIAVGDSTGITGNTRPKCSGIPRFQEFLTQVLFAAMDCP